MSITEKSLLVGFFIVVAGCVAPLCAQAEEIPERGPIPFAAYDRDGNNLISEEEFNTVRGERMAQRTAEGRPMRGAAMALTFIELDKNGDGQITREELAAGQKAQREERRQMGEGQDRGWGQGMGQGMGRDRGSDMPSFSEYDLDGDGKIVENEFDDMRSKRISERVKKGYQMRNLGSAPSFAYIDSNGDGEISKDEFEDHQSRRRERRMQ